MRIDPRWNRVEHCPGAMFLHATDGCEQVIFDPGRWTPGQACAEGIAVAIVEIGVRGDLVREAIALLIHASDAQQQRVFHDRHVERAAHFNRVIIAVLDLAVALEPISRTLRFEKDGAAGRITTKQRALWPTQNLQAGEIIIVEAAAILRIVALVGNKRNFGRIQHHARRGVEGRTLAADRDIFGAALLP